MAGLCIFLGVNTHYFNDFETNLNLKTKKGRDFSDVIRTIKDIMFSQKFEGAAVGAFQQNIIARDLGLANKNEITHIVEQPLFGDDDEG
ncbi:DNA packaging protein [Flavobacterium phage FPSV-S2]|nr:DNA packaging protein [Flavobacterium phage FPSV-S2]